MIYQIYIVFLLSTFIFSFDFSISDLPVQENGRIKPIDTFARNQLLAIYGKRSIKKSFEQQKANNRISAVEWLFDITLYPDEAYKYKIFNIRNPEVVGSLGLKWDSNHLYSSSDILIGLQNQLDYISKIQNFPRKDLTEFDFQMLNVYNNVVQFQQLCYSFTCILDLITIDDSTLAEKLKISPGSKISYYRVMQNANKLIELSNLVIEKETHEWTTSDSALSLLLNQVHLIDQDKYAQNIKLIPPSINSPDESWFSPWELMDGRELELEQKEVLSALSNFLNSQLITESNDASASLLQYQNSLDSYNTLFKIKNLKTESWYNKSELFYKSLALYILSFLLLSISWMVANTLPYRASFIALLLGLIFHLTGIILRIIIMSRPPISTLYESIIFVSFISVLCAVILEYSRKDGIGIFVGSICGIVLHFVGLGYADDGDTLGMLVAVLNSNFWLATHVTTITIGYGTSLFAGLLGHVYLIQKIIRPKDTNYLKSIFSNVYGVTLFALLFTMIGTILGGIWADQSWGRFWGWDPKENGALLIVMWQIMMLHLRITGYVKPIGFSLGMALNNIVVIIAWFGVNLLSVGLHSYGFAEGIARNILIYIIVELLFSFGTYALAKKKA